MSNPFKKLLGQTAIYGLSSIVGRLLNYLLVPLHLAFFDHPSDYGVLSELYAWVAFLIVLLTFGMETSFFRFLQNSDDQEKVFRNAFASLIGINLLYYIALLFFNQGIADAMLFSEHNEYIILLGTIVAIDAVSALPLAKLRAEEKAKKFALIQFSSIMTNVVLNIFFLMVFFDASRPEEGILFILFANLISSLVKPLLLYKDFLKINWNLDFTLIREMFIYAFPLVIAGFAGIINETMDRILLKFTLYDGITPESLIDAEAQVGIYSANYKLAMLVTILIQAYRYAAEPFFFAQLKNQDRQLVYRKVMNYFIAAVCLVFLGVSLNIDIFKYFVNNENYWEGLKVIPILLLANVFLGIYINQSIWYKLSNQTRFGAYIAICGAVLTLLINLIFIPFYGYMASAWATLIVYASQMVASYFLGQKFYPIKYNVRKFFLYLISALMLFAFARILDLEQPTIRFVVHNLMIGLYIWLVYTMERASFKSGNG